MDPKFEEVKKVFQEGMAEKADAKTVEALTKKLEDLEKRYLELLPYANQTRGEVPIAKGVFWKSEDSAKEFVRFAKAVHEGDTQYIRAKAQMTEGLNVEGGYLVPKEFLATLIRLIWEFGEVRKRSTVIPMAGQMMEIPKLASGPAVYWTNEAMAPTVESAPSFGQVVLTTKKMMALVPISQELLDDSSIAVANLIVVLLAEAMAKEEDRTALVGTSGIFATGSISQITAPQVVTLSGAGATSFDKILAEDLLYLTGAVSSPAVSGGVFFLHRTVMNVIRTLRDSAGGRFIWQPPTLAEPGTIWGYPYVQTDIMPDMATAVQNGGKTFVLFGNFKHYYIGDRQQLTMASSNHIGFKTDQIYLRATQRIAHAIAIPEAFARLVTG